ncbi:unnamed protein product [Coregonus sp. 'balchen']|nr:unnamed protein product [Coregonus sp. 'balchen']
MAQPAERAYYRFLVLFFNCLLTFGSYFCFDIPSVLQDQFQGNLTCANTTVINGTVDCVEGLGMTPQEYNLLYAIYAWTNAVVVIMAGFLIDKLGNRFGVFLFSFLCVLGSAIFALGSHFKGTAYLLPLMLTGLVQNRITAFWFRGKELALAFGLTLAFSRLGSVLNFFLTQRFQDVKLLSLRYWLLDKYSDYSQKEAAYIAGAVYDSSLVLSATVGILIDNVGLRGVFAVACAVLTLPVFGLLAFTFVPPLVSTIWLGASMWPSIPLVVPQATLGTAMGLATSVQMIGIGISNLVVGQILGTKSSDAKIPLWRWQQMMVFMLANTIACIVTSVVLNIVDHRQGGILNKTTKRSGAPPPSGPSDREPLVEGEEGQNEEEEEGAVRSPSINSS